MTESKITLTHRLQREGRWEEASLFKDSHIAQLKAEGKPRKEAQQAAWEGMEKRFPPQTIETEPEALATLPSDLAHRLNSSSDDFVRDALWVYDRLGLAGVTLKDAPSLGAWSLLRWARRNEDRFFEQILPKVMAKSPKTLSSGPEAEPVSNERKQIMTLKKMLSGSYLKWEQEAVADTAQAVKDKVTDQFSDWQKKYSLELPQYARESWRLRMIRLSDDLIHAALKYPDQYQTRKDDGLCN